MGVAKNSHAPIEGYMVRINNLQDVVAAISRMETLSIPCINNGTPYVRLDEIADILDHIPVANIDKLYQRVKEANKCNNTQEDTH